MATRNETLMIARQATDNAPVSRVTYTDRELAQRDAMRSALDALRGPQGLSQKWRAENARQVTTRKRLAREAVAMAWLRVKATRKLESGPEIVTSVTVILPFEQPFPLTRRVLRGKVVKPAKTGRVSVLKDFFSAVAVFVNG